MRILDRYIGITIISAIVTVLVVLVAIFSFFAFIEQLEDIGRGTYGLVQVALYVLLNLPKLTYQLFPMAALIGALIGFGTMMRNGEITVVRCVGVAKYRVVYAVLKAGAFVVVVAMLIGELIAPPTEHFARDFRNLALDDRITASSDAGFWARDGNSYINIQQVLPGNQVMDVYIYEFDPDNRLRRSTHADRAHYRKSQGTWILEGISQTEFKGMEISRRSLDKATWDSGLKPDLISLVTINPEDLSMWSLYKYSRFLRGNGQSAQRYDHALWVRASYPLVIAMMIVLAVPMVMRANRTTPVGQSVLYGGLIGLGFHLLNQAAGHLGTVYDWPPVLSATGPALLVSVAALGLLTSTR